MGEFRSIVDGEGSLKANDIRELVKSPAVDPKQRQLAGVDALLVIKYWENFFLPQDVARKERYRRPPSLDPADADRLEKIPRGSNRNISWKGPYQVEREWDYDDDGTRRIPE